jgi:putative endonuclease
VWPFRRNESTGKRGERLAAKTLKSAGCTILARNYRCPVGESDLIGLTGDTLVFAEVKTRSADKYTDPESAVNEAKRARYRNVARYYLQRTGRGDLNVRFDVIAIVIPGDDKPRIKHIPDAFV